MADNNKNDNQVALDALGVAKDQVELQPVGIIQNVTDGIRSMLGMEQPAVSDTTTNSGLECVPDDTNNLECAPVEDEKILACLPPEKAPVPTNTLACLPPEASKEALACLPGDTTLACLPAENQNTTPALVCKPDPACKPLYAAPVMEGLGIDKSKDIDQQLENRVDLSEKTMAN